MILVNIESLRGFGNSTLEGYGDGNWFMADSFSFGVERELRQTGNRGGTQDVNIGVGELQECTISKSMDATSPLLAQFAINGNAAGSGEIHFLSSTGDGKPVCYLQYKLDRCFVKSWSTSGDADDRPTEEVAFYYNKIAFVALGQPDAFSWDRAKATAWTGHGLPELKEPPSPR